MLIYLSLLDSEKDKSQFEKIYTANHLKMYYVALGILKNQQEAEDAVYDAFLFLAERFEKYSCLDENKIQGLCIVMAKNRAIDILRKRAHLSDAEIETIIICEDDMEWNPEKKYENSEFQEMVRACLNQLPEILKQTMILKFYYEYKNQEIAKLMNTSVKNVEMRIYRGKQKMKEVIRHENLCRRSDL